MENSEPKPNGAALFVLGILSAMFGPFTAIPGLIMSKRFRPFTATAATGYFLCWFFLIFTLLAIVPDNIWITANFKETQLTHMRPGQPVEISVDAYPGLRIRGHVDSIQSGAGARFSLFPPENASGNYVKVVQRVPVKIVLDDAQGGRVLGPGMSVVPEVRVR